MKKFIKRKNWGEHYLRYLISYMTILLIPILILTFFYSSRFMKKFYEEIYETVDLELIQISTQMDNELESMQGIISQLALTGTIQKAALADSPAKLSPVISYLSGFLSTNSFIGDIALIPNKNDYVVTSTTTCEKDYYFNRILYNPMPDAEELRDNLKKAPAFFCIPEQKLYNKDMVLFSYPLFTDYQRHGGTVFFYVNKQSIESLLSQKLNSYHAKIYFMAPDGTIINFSNGAEHENSDIQNYLKESALQGFPVAFRNKEYMARTFHSKESGWSYFAFLPDKQTTFSQVTDMMKEFLWAIVIILFIASFTIFFLQRVNYAPVKRLRDKAREISPNEASTDELATISHALDYLSLQNSSLSTQLANSFTAVKNDRLYRLLAGNYDSTDNFNLDCSELELELLNQYFTVCILMLHSTVRDIEALALEIKKQLQVPYVYYFLHNFSPNQIVLLFNLPQENELPYALIQSTQSYLQKNHKLLSTIGIGTIVDSTTRIPQSYMEAVSALDYRFVKGNGTTIEFKEALGPVQAKVTYPHQEFEALKNTLLSQNEKHIRVAIQTIIQFMEQAQLPLYLARSICFDLIHLVNEHCHNQKHTTSGSPLQLSGVETAQEIIQMLRTWSEQLSGLTALPSRKVMIEDVVHFINNNCLRCDFSAYEAAEHFEMTLPAFSKYFKEQTGQNVMDYTIGLRIQRAKELLRDTDLPLREIGEQVGYYNISSFTRRFKLNQGITPSDYRKISFKDV